MAINFCFQAICFTGLRLPIESDIFMTLSPRKDLSCEMIQQTHWRHICGQPFCRLFIMLETLRGTHNSRAKRWIWQQALQVIQERLQPKEKQYGSVHLTSPGLIKWKTHQPSSTGPPSEVFLPRYAVLIQTAPYDEKQINNKRSPEKIPLHNFPGCATMN